MAQHEKAGNTEDFGSRLLSGLKDMLIEEDAPAKKAEAEAHSAPSPAAPAMHCADTPDVHEQVDRRYALTGLDWRLHAVMADRGIKFAKDLQQALAGDGCTVSGSSISRLVYQEPKQLDLKLLSSLCRVLDCTPDELLVPRRAKLLAGL